jgi:hypothetical protein
MLCSPLLILTVQPATKLDIVLYFLYESLKVAPIFVIAIPELKTREAQTLYPRLR